MVLGREVSVRNLGLVFVSLIFSVLVAEGMVRVLFDEVDYLRPELIPHPTLGHAVRPGSSGHDAWGFRNLSVPNDVTILAVGDSQTYGVSATRSQSWPAQLAKITGLSTYNLALGGYGPREYLQLIRQKANLVDPEIILIGFYFGNDLFDVRPADAKKISPVAKVLKPKKSSLLRRLRTWLSQNSVVYQMSKHTAKSLNFDARLIETANDLKNQSYVFFIDGEVRSILTPTLRHKYLDQSTEANRQALVLTMNIFVEIQKECERLGSQCVFLLTPTKESVYWPRVQKTLKGAPLDAVTLLVQTERDVRQTLVSFFREKKLRYIDLLPDMRTAAQNRGLYPESQDGHPTGVGYGVIAGSIRNYFDAENLVSATIKNK